MLTTTRSMLLASCVALGVGFGTAAVAGQPDGKAQVLRAETGTMVLARQGADDGPDHDANDDRGGKGRGADDGPNHA